MAIDAALMHDLACQYALIPTEDHLNRALTACLPLCALIARRFLNRGAEYDDLYQAACLSCVNALKSFDPNRGLKFSTFVTPTVTGSVRNYLRDQAPLLRAPRALREKGMILEKTREAYLAAHHAEPTARQLAEALGWEMESVLAVWTALSASHVASLEEADENGLTLGERLPFLEPGFENAEQRAFTRYIVVFCRTCNNLPAAQKGRKEAHNGSVMPASLNRCADPSCHIWPSGFLDILLSLYRSSDSSYQSFARQEKTSGCNQIGLVIAPCFGRMRAFPVRPFGLANCP